VPIIRLSSGIELDPSRIVRAIFTAKASPLSVRPTGPQPLATTDTLNIETIEGFEIVRGAFARQDGKALEAAGVPVFWSDARD
jgi:hypothetical protein